MMSSSPLVVYTALSPTCSTRTAKIDKITIHHAAGVGTAEAIGNVFQTKEASANYGIGNDGRIGMYVPEDKRSWASSNIPNDNRAITIEVSNSATGGQWPVSDVAYSALIDLCVDICQRNGIDKLIYTGDATGNLTAHRFFVSTACPGEYLFQRFPQIAAEVNKRLEDTMTGEEIYNKLNDFLKSQPAPDWAEAELAQAVAMGITDGTRPMELIPRYQAAIMAKRAAEQAKM